MSRQRDAIGVPTEGGYVLLQPVQGSDDVHQSVISWKLRIPIRIGVQKACK